MDTRLLRRGINMDHMFMPYRRSLDPVTETEWTGMEGSLKSAEYEAAAKCGFSHIRLCLGRDFLQSRTTPYGFHDRGFELMFRSVDMARKAGLAVILDLHELTAPEFKKEPGLVEPFIAFWREMAKRCRHLPADVFYGLLNEPVTADPTLWKGIVIKAVAAIREADPDRPVIVAGDGWGNLASLVALGELGLPNIIYDFHFYDPFAVTHQGAGWGSPSLKPMHGIDYPMNRPEFMKSWDEFKKTGLDDWPFRDYEKMPDREGLARKLAPVIEWGKKTGLPLYCGEFGVRRDGAPVEVRARWTRDVRTILENAGIPWALWSYHSGFDLFDRQNNPDRVLLEALGM
jgi:aryl-phospho-beta-D-glucosidase BglC (GH1 family)